MNKVSKKLQDAQTTGNGVSHDCRGDGAQIGWYITPAGAISGGKVQVETSDDSANTGTWYPLASEITLAAGVTIYQSFTGPLNAVRARISSDVTGGGTVTVKLLRSS